MHGARNLNPVITLKNLLRRTCCPQAGGRCSVTGRLWPFPDRDGETGPATRLLREGILIPDLMVAFNINVAVSMWPASSPGAVTPC